MDRNNVLEVKDLHVSFHTYNGEVQAVRGVSFEEKKGETVAVVGESGCGKSVTSQSIMRLIPQPPGVFKHGEILFEGNDLTKLPEKQMEGIRGKDIAMIFQDPMTSLNPTMTIGKQIMEGLVKHRKLGRAEAKEKALEMLRLVGIPSPGSRIDQYPHQFSGGMRQRAMIAIALACAPKLLIADEPTTALDVTIQAQILDLMNDLKEKMDTSIILITHDLGVVAETADRVVVMYAGKVVETGTVEEIFNRPRHPYTWGLMGSMPRMDLSRDTELTPILGAPPNLLSPPKGCPFASRCPHAMKVCKEQMPETTDASGTQRVACWLEHPMAPSVEIPHDLVGGASK
ncbi:ABC transporter ATP-binding protein [Marininema halotolerans]|uniref:Oligopeptide transport system ATP-binding protein n=1 Tax=Marininema halotolerans TaxID=1155944 RepID=A0A1I6PT27_9BACL|nr:ABC transporter ATP-binding protein [Marininema halotolerans]SFS43326.1 oligopeptide transport system ATP-binding protein [Marininema halotolerans]